MFVPELVIFCLILFPDPAENPERLPELAVAVHEKVVVVTSPVRKICVESPEQMSDNRLEFVIWGMVSTVTTIVSWLI